MCRGGSASKDLRAGDGKRTSGCVNVPVCLLRAVGASSAPQAALAFLRAAACSGASRTGGSYPTREPWAPPRWQEAVRVCAELLGSPSKCQPRIWEAGEKVARYPGFGVRSTGVRRARVGPRDRAADRGRPVTAGAGG